MKKIVRTVSIGLLSGLAFLAACTSSKTSAKPEANAANQEEINEMNARLNRIEQRIKEMKNPQTVVEALSHFTKEELGKYNPHIVFAGKNCMRESLQTLIKQKGLESRVHFLGFIPVEKVRDIMCMSDLYLIASDYEGTSVSLLEAMYNSMPILASDVKGINDMVRNREEALLFPAKDATGLKCLIIEYLESESLRVKLGKNAREFYDSRYAYSFVIESYKNILDLQ